MPSTASRRCSSTCCATRRPPTSAWPSTSRARPSGPRSTPSTRPAARPPRPSSPGSCRCCARCSTRCASATSGVEGFEADDVIATLTHRAVEQGHEVVICTGDRDAFQLVSDKVTLLYPVRGVSEVWRMDPAAVTEKYLVPPERYSDLAALVGESSDNLPGVPGVGPKTAAKWLGAVRRPRRGGRPRRRDQGQGRREPARAPRRRAAQPPPQPARRRPRPAAVGRRPRAPVLGPRGGAPGLRRPGVPGAARAAVPDLRGREGRGRGWLRARRATCSPPTTS